MEATALSLGARRWLTLSRGVIIGVGLLFFLVSILGTSVPLRVQAVVYLVGMVALNLPHGGFEHFMNLRKRRLSFALRYVAGFILLIIFFAALFFVEPILGLSLAFVVAMAKGGGGDVKVMQATGSGAHLTGRGQKILAAVARGLPVMLLPIAFHTEAFWWFAGLMVGMFDPSSALPMRNLLTFSAPYVGAAALAAAAIHVLWGFFSARRVARGADEEGRVSAWRSWRTDLLDTALLILFFAAVPAVVAVGVYFPFWYSVRQVGRSVAVEDTLEPEPGALFADLDAMTPQKIALTAWLILMIGATMTLGVAAMIWFVIPNPAMQAEWLFTGVAFWSVFISIVALPHVLVGEFFDRKRGIWYAPAAKLTPQG